MDQIIVTNDDGVHAPGILALAQAMRALGEVTVIAPSVNQSSSGHKKTLHTDIPVSSTTLADGTPALSVGGSPADGIALAALGMGRWNPPKLVVSGINRGGNMGQDITYSGTVTAALEAAISGVPALAVSLDRRDADDVADYAEAARIAVIVARHMLARPLPPLTILNLNVPKGAVRGIRLTRQGVRIYRDALETGEGVYRMTGPEPTGNLDQIGTDLWAVHQGYASLTPIHLDMTAHALIAEVAAWDIAV